MGKKQQEALETCEAPGGATILQRDINTHLVNNLSHDEYSEHAEVKEGQLLHDLKASGVFIPKFPIIPNVAQAARHLDGNQEGRK